MRGLISAALVAGALLLPPAAAAQDSPPQPLPEEPIGLFVADVRGVWAPFKNDAAVAQALGVNAADLPTRGFGLALGAHLYPVRRQGFALGLGAELLVRARGSRTQPAAIENGPDGPTTVTRLSAFSPQASLNFGKRNGWSYLSAGVGSAAYSTELQAPADAGDSTRRRAINYGGGARWFVSRHVAFTFDVRFYSVNARAAAATLPAVPRTRLMVLSAGLSAR